MIEKHLAERSIFLAALDIESADERKAYLDSVCGTRSELRGAVEALLKEHETTQGLLDSPGLVVSAEDQTWDDAALGSTIGPYTLLREIGEGGMGRSIWPSSMNRSTVRWP